MGNQWTYENDEKLDFLETKVKYDSTGTGCNITQRAARGCGTPPPSTVNSPGDLCVSVLTDVSIIPKIKPGAVRELSRELQCTVGQLWPTVTLILICGQSRFLTMVI